MGWLEATEGLLALFWETFGEDDIWDEVWEDLWDGEDVKGLFWLFELDDDFFEAADDFCVGTDDFRE